MYWEVIVKQLDRVILSRRRRIWGRGVPHHPRPFVRLGQTQGDTGNPYTGLIR